MDAGEKQSLERRSVKLGQISQLMLPPFPAFPDSMVRRFPELGAYNEAVSRWLDRANTAIASALTSPEKAS